MERTHRQAGEPRGLHLHDPVSILVVMERTHRRHHAERRSGRRESSFNPCCDGTDSSTPIQKFYIMTVSQCFNPCCDGTDSSTRHRDGPDDGADGVSILVVMERTHRLRDRCCKVRTRTVVSILVVMERTHRHRMLTQEQSLGEEVSILVVMERTHRLGAARRGGLGSGHVSILVVMERTHRHGHRRRQRPRRLGFNPCCDGTDSSTWSRVVRSWEEPGVSILVVMERTHRPLVAASHWFPTRRFNPCCDGTDSSTSWSARSFVLGGKVSILVVMERTHRRSCQSSSGEFVMRFQSLL